MKKFKNLISEIQQPLSQGEKNFKDMHGDLPAAIEKARKLVPGITDQDVLFNGRPRRIDQPNASIEDIKKSVDNYDKGLKVGPNPEKTMSEELEKETIKHPVGQRPKGIGWVLKQAGEQTGKDHSVWERKVMRIGKVKVNEATMAGIDSAAFVKKYHENEDDNAHSENVKLLAKHFGTEADYKKAVDIHNKHMKIGHLPKDLGKQRYALHTKLMKQAKPHFDKVKAEINEADLTKIDTKTLQTLTQLHKHYGQKDPRAKASSERGEAELKRREDAKKKTERVSEALGTIKNFKAASKFNSSNVSDMIRGEKARKTSQDLGVSAKDHKSEYSKMRKDMGMDDNKKTRDIIGEKTLTPAEIKKREEIAKSIERDNPDMPMDKKMAIATATAKRVAEEAEMDYEGEMARSELNAICDKSRKLADMMADDMQLEAWLQSKITKAKYMIDSVYDYLMYSDKQSGMKSPMPSADVSSYAQTPAMAANYSSFLNKMAEEKILSAKQKAIAALAGDEDEIDADDFKKLRSSKKGSDTEETTAHRKKIISKTVEEAKEDDEEKEDKQSGASLNPITRLNAAHQLLRGKIGIKHPIKFDDGKHELDINTVRKALDLHGNAKTAAEKEKIQNAFKTHSGLQDALKGKFAAPRNKVSLGGSKLIGGIKEDSDLDERVNPTTRPAAVGALRAATFRDKFGVLRMSKPTKGIPSNRDVVDASIAEQEKPKTSKANMQQDSLDRLNAMSPQASKMKIKLPPTQGNETIGGEEEVYPNVALEETMLNSLYHSLSEDNKATFIEKLKTEDGLTELLQFAQEQGF